MKLIVLAAGYATRLYPLTLNQPKPLLAVAGKPMLEHVLDNLMPIDEIERREGANERVGVRAGVRRDDDAKDFHRSGGIGIEAPGHNHGGVAASAECRADGDRRRWRYR